MSNGVKGFEILVVDDDRQVADLLVEYLNANGYEATAAYGGKDALDMSSAGDFKLVITDLMMPDMDGMLLLERLKKLNRKVVVVMITGFGTVERAVQAIKKGAYDFITKPVNTKMLDVVVERAVERYLIYERLGTFRRMFFFVAYIVPLLVLIIILLIRFWPF